MGKVRRDVQVNIVDKLNTQVFHIGREHLVSFYQCYIQILVLGAQGIRATGFKRAQGNAHCAKFESHTNRVTFETNAIRMTPSVQAPSTTTSIVNSFYIHSMTLDVVEMYFYTI